MKVSDLIEILKTFPEDTIVVTDGYEDGYEPLKKVKLIKVTEMEEKQWYYGKYDWSNSSNAIEVVFLDADIRNEERVQR